MSVVKSGKKLVLPELQNGYEIAQACRVAAMSEANLTFDGKPKVEVLEDILGFDIDAEDRDAVWEAMQ